MSSAPPADTGSDARPSQAPPVRVEDRLPVPPWRSAFGGWTVWSEPVDGEFLLFARRAGRTKQLPAPASRVAHDPGVGRGPDGQVSAVYQRCTGIACQIWLVDLATRRQRRVAGLGTARREVARASEDDVPWVETHPRLWGSRVAFKTGGTESTQPRMRIGPAAGRGRVRTVRMDPGEDGGQLEQIAVGPKHVVAFWQDDFCFGRCAGLYIVGIASGRQRELDDARGNADCVDLIGDVRFDGRAFRWTRELSPIQSGSTACPGRVIRLRYDPRTGRRTAS